MFLYLYCSDLTNNPGGSFRGATTGSNGSTIQNAWQGQFYGNTGLATPTVTDNYPQVAVGEFEGDFGNENKAVGVFGVEQKSRLNPNKG